ncbi:MAG: hypothetical protein FWE11_04850 [Defluviitaleaceae bacterium]|nr:hypothetical protein [Defluviitaleaceae bacterium]
MNNKAWTIAKINYKTLRVLLIPTLSTMFALAISDIINYFVMSGTGGTGISISPANALWLLPVMVAIALPAFSLRRIINLGGKRDGFFWGGILTYVILAAVASLLVTLSHFTIEQLLERSPYFDPNFLGGIVNLVEVFGWSDRGFVITFFQQTALLILFAAFVHTLTASQGKWYGWVANVAIVAIISVFTPIPVLRRALVWFFNLILFHPNAWMQIIGCLVIAAGVYALSKPIIARKAI